MDSPTGTTPAVATRDEQINTNAPAHNYDHYRDTTQQHHDTDHEHNHNHNLKSLDVMHKDVFGRNGPMNSRAWWWIGGSVVCTAIVLCLVCIVLPLVVFLIVFFSILQESEDMREHSNEMVGGSSPSGPQVHLSNGDPSDYPEGLFFNDGI